MSEVARRREAEDRIASHRRTERGGRKKEGETNARVRASLTKK